MYSCIYSCSIFHSRNNYSLTSPVNTEKKSQGDLGLGHLSTVNLFAATVLLCIYISHNVLSPVKWSKGNQSVLWDQILPSVHHVLGP